MQYHDYTITISSDPSTCGSECTPEQSARITVKWVDLINAQFAGIRLAVIPDICPTIVMGEKQAIIDEITNWLNKNYFLACQLPEAVAPDKYQLQDLWHYATTIRFGAKKDSAFATSSLLGRLDLVRDARQCIYKTVIPDGDFCLHPSWSDVADRLDVSLIASEQQLKRVGRELINLVNRECTRLGVNGRTAESVSV